MRLFFKFYLFSNSENSDSDKYASSPRDAAQVDKSLCDAGTQGGGEAEAEAWEGAFVIGIFRIGELPEISKEVRKRILKIYYA